MKKWYLCFVALAFVLWAGLTPLSGNQRWIARYDGSGDDSGRGIVVDDGGFVYVTAKSQNTRGDYDVVTIKYDPVNGDTLWATWFDGGDGDDIPRDIAAGCNAVFVVGQTDVGHDNDYLIIKYDTESGDTVWVKRYNGPSNDGDEAYGVAVFGPQFYVTGESSDGSYDDIVTIRYLCSTGSRLSMHRYDHLTSDYAVAIDVDDEGDYYVTGGSYNGIAKNMDYITIKYNHLTGDTVWVKTYDGTAVTGNYDFAWDIDVCDGHVYVTGESDGYLSNRDIVTICYRSTDGDVLWSERWNDVDDNDDIGYAIACDTDGVWVTGKMLNYPSFDQWCIPTIHYDTDGNELCYDVYCGAWPYGLETGRDIAVDGAGNAYVVGNVLEPVQGSDYVTIKYASNCDVIWEETYDGPAGSTDEAYAVALDDSWNVYVTGGSGGAGTGMDIATIKYRQADPEFVRSDVQADGDHDIFDAIYMLNWLGGLNPPPPCINACDVDEDCDTDLFDAIYFLNWIGGCNQRPSPPCCWGDPEDPCGPDPLFCGLSCDSFPPCGTKVADKTVAVRSYEESKLMVQNGVVTLVNAEPILGFAFTIEYDGTAAKAVDNSGLATEDFAFFLENVEAPGVIKVVALTDLDMSDGVELLPAGEHVVARIVLEDKQDATLRVVNSVMALDDVRALEHQIVVKSAMPAAFQLEQNYPNPFNPTTEIRYAVPQDCHVKLEIYNTLGQRVATLVDEAQRAGHKTVTWDASNCASGIYFYRISAGDFAATRKMILIR